MIKMYKKYIYIKEGKFLAIHRFIYNTIYMYNIYRLKSYTRSIFTIHIQLLKFMKITRMPVQFNGTLYTCGDQNNMRLLNAATISFLVVAVLYYAYVRACMKYSPRKDMFFPWTRVKKKNKQLFFAKKRQKKNERVRGHTHMPRNKLKPK